MINQLVSLQSHIKEMLDNELEIFQEPLSDSIKEIITYYYSLGGKKLRPVLFLAVARAFNSEENLSPHALAIELIHTMSLYHDDVIDGAMQRRGAPTVHEKWNEATAIVGGDILHALIHGHIIDAIEKKRVKNPELSIKFLNDLIHVIEVKIGTAVIDEMRLSESPEIPDLEKSIQVTAGKTAPLFAFSAAAGCYIANRAIKLSHDMYDMGWKIGYAFQLLDDLSDFFHNDKDIGGDLREDKKTPLIVLCHKSNPDKLKYYRDRKAKLTKNDILQFKLDFKTEMKEILNWANNEIQDAKRYLDDIPTNQDKEIIISLFKLLQLKVEELSIVID